MVRRGRSNRSSTRYRPYPLHPTERSDAGIHIRGIRRCHALSREWQARSLRRNRREPPRTQRFIGAKAGWPPGGDTQGHGTPRRAGKEHRRAQPVKGQPMKMGQSTSGESDVQGRYREVLTPKGMRNAKHRNVSGTASRARHTRSAARTRLSTTVEPKPVAVRRWQRRQECWRIHARRHRRNSGCDVAEHHGYHDRSVTHPTVSMAASETDLHTQTQRQKASVRSAGLVR